MNEAALEKLGAALLTNARRETLAAALFATLLFCRPLRLLCFLCLFFLCHIVVVMFPITRPALRA